MKQNQNDKYFNKSSSTVAKVCLLKISDSPFDFIKSILKENHHIRRIDSMLTDFSFSCDLFFYIFIQLMEPHSNSSETI